MVLAMWRRAVTNQEGGDKRSAAYITGDNITSGRVTGTSRAYTLDRLKREAPALFERVCSGEMSANAAAIQAGFRDGLRVEQRVPKCVAMRR